MKLRLISLLIVLTTAFLSACVDPYEPEFSATVDVLVVDGTINNLPEPQRILLNRSRADPATGRFGVLPITKAFVEVIVDSSERIACHETVDGVYLLPSDFRGRVGHSYQLRFQLREGLTYVSTHQTMVGVPEVDRLSVTFNPNSLPLGLYPNRFRAGYDLSVATQDPPDQQNQYRWDWRLYEKQKWCKTCYQQVYVDSIQQGSIQNGVFVFIRQAVESCQDPASKPNGDFYNDYTCRAPCWEIIENVTLHLFDDQLTNGGTLSGRPVGQVPLLTRQPALLEVRQSSLTRDAYRFYELFRQQTQNTGGLADTPPSAPVGNVRNTANAAEPVVGFFTASAVSTTRYWLNKKDATSLPVGAYDDTGQIVQFDDELFYALNSRQPSHGRGGTPFTAGAPERLITAPCLPGTNRTPLQPTGWRDE